MDRTKLGAALGAALLLGACQSLIGLDQPSLGQPLDAGSDAHVDHDHDGGPSGDGGVPDASAAQVAACDEFCNDVGEACDGTNGAQAYNTPEACRSLCLYYDHDSSETSGATFACRADRAAQAVASKGVSEERPFVDALCAMASPGGGGEADGLAGCGSNCENFCQLRNSLCGDSTDQAICEAQCAALVDAREVNAGSDFLDRPDTVQCRLAHLSMAAAQGPNHCEHARLNPIRGDDTVVRCDLNPKSVTRASLCDNYCHVVTRTCTGDSAVWDDEPQCLAACNNELGVPLGTVFDYGQDSWGCRRAHAYTALTLLGGESHDHCSHASLGGGGSDHCGDPCVSFCSQAAGACSTEFAARFSDQARCVTNCQDVTGGDTKDVSYTRALGEKGGNTYACRLHALIDVLAGDATSCGAVLGGAPCQ
jgi:hypothetical protein